MRTSRFMGAGKAAGAVSCRLFLIMLAMLALILNGCGRGADAKLDPDMARLVTEKRAQARELAGVQTNPVPVDVWRFFDAVQQGDWHRTTNMFDRLQKASGRGPSYRVPPKNLWGVVRGWLNDWLRAGSKFQPAPALNTALWCPVQETLGVAEVFHDWDGKLLHRYGHDIIESIPTNSIYFGGTDPGRFVITALSQSHRQAKPFFTLTQNALADGTYLDYLRRMYGSRIYIPTAVDSQRMFNEYLQDAQERLQAGKLKPGEDVKNLNNRVTVSGQVAVMEINARLAKIIFDQNPSREFYVEESFPLDWMYPYLSPHGLILKLNREPLRELNDVLVRADRDYWRRYASQLLGDWLTEETSVQEVCDFAERVYLRKDLGTFRGDRAFLGNATAQKSFSKLRSAIGGVYAWRATHAEASDEKGRMQKEADFAFRQALAMCPYSPEAVFRYVQLLLSQNRRKEALLVAETCKRIDPNNTQVAGLAEQLKKLQ
jgi:hypothetical protein